MNKNTEQKVWEAYESPDITLVTIASRSVLCASQQTEGFTVDDRGEW